MAYVHNRPAVRSAAASLRRVVPLSTALVLLFVSSGADARPHKCIDPQGRVTYSDTLCPETRNSERAVALGSPQRISVQQVEAMIAAADEAARRKDYDKLMTYYADDAVVEFVVRVGHRTGRQSLRKRELFEYARRHAEEMNGSTTRRDKVSIDIAPNGTQAEVRTKVTENFSKNGQRLMMTYEEQSLLELRDGRLQVIHAYVITDGGPRELR
jgi:ketosteroid isomerase-like protein